MATGMISYLLIHCLTVLAHCLGDAPALLLRDVPALLLGDVSAFFSGDGFAFLSGNLKESQSQD